MIRVLLADSNPARREQLRAVLAADPEITVAGQARDGQEALQLAHALRPDVAVLAADLSAGDGYQTAERLAASGLPLVSLILSEIDRPDDLRRAMRAGARGGLSWSSAPVHLVEAVRELDAERHHRQTPGWAAAADPRAAARVFAVSGAKGGVGKTTLAVNLAAALASQTGEPTVLLDLYTQFGDAALLLNLAPRRTLADLTRLDLGDLDERALEDHLERHESGLAVLAGATAPLPPDAFDPVRLDRLLGLLKCGHRYVVLDVPPVLNPTTLYALSHASSVFLVANLFDLTTLADSRLWLNAVVGPHVAPEAIRVILNRVTARNRLQVPDIERTLGRTVGACIPNDGRLVPASVNAGLPVVLSHPHSRVSQAIFGLAQSLAAPSPDPLTPTVSALPRRRAIFAPLLRKGI